MDPKLKSVALILAIWATCDAADSNDAPKPDNGLQLAPAPFLRFYGRDSVELGNTAYLLDVDSVFTIEVWVRWSPNNKDLITIAGDEAWPGMASNVEAKTISGWVLRTTSLQDADQRRIDFTLGVRSDEVASWKSLVSEPRRCIEPGGWHHIAICRTRLSMTLFWNGFPAASAPLAGLKFIPSATNMFLGIRKSAPENRLCFGDIRGFRVSNKVRYTKQFVPPEVLDRDDETLLLIDFSKAKGNLIPDASGKHHDGTITGARPIVNK